MTTRRTDPQLLAKQFIDASIDGRPKQPSKAAYARGLKLAHQAMEQLLQLSEARRRPRRSET
jgi:hypothetical protein